MRYRFARIEWNELAAKHLIRACGKEEPEHYAEWLACEVKSERVVLLAVINGENRYVASIAVRDDIDETVLIAAGGEEKGVFLFPRVYPDLERVLRLLGATNLRMDAVRYGTAIWASRLGFKADGSNGTFRKDLMDGGQKQFQIVNDANDNNKPD